PDADRIRVSRLGARAGRDVPAPQRPAEVLREDRRQREQARALVLPPLRPAEVLREDGRQREQARALVLPRLRHAGPRGGAREPADLLAPHRLPASACRAPPATADLV